EDAYGALHCVPTRRSSDLGGVVVVAYLSALCNLSFTATQFALLSAAASVVGRMLTGTTAGALIEAMGYVNFYLLTTLVALPGIRSEEHTSELQSRENLVCR